MCSCRVLDLMQLSLKYKKLMDIDLLSLVEYGGCSSKLPASELEKVLKHFPKITDPNLLVDIDTQDDAAVYKISENQALIFTTDFFPPICSDPFEFGQIAAANSLSDVYAMGGRPLLALNIAMFPATMPLEAYARILEGGLSKVTESGALLVGGHTIDDTPPKYGLAVIGMVDPAKIVTNAGLSPGEILILTKPIGSGILVSGKKVGLAKEEAYRQALENMKILNSNVLDTFHDASVRGGTDVTGFGLIGHALKMARASKVSIHIKASSVPYLSQAYSLADDGCIPGATFRNLKYAESETYFTPSVPFAYRALLADAQTSGGIVFGIDASLAQNAILKLRQSGAVQASIIGTVKEKVDNYHLYIT